MTKYHTNQKVYVKSNNNSHIIISRYTYTLIAFAILSIIINLIIGNKALVISFIKSLLITLIITSITNYIINITKKKYILLDIYTKDNTVAIAIILALFGIKTNIYILIIACIISIIIKAFSKNINLSSTLYGILIIMIYNTYILDIETPLTILKNQTFEELLAYSGGIINTLFSIEYLSPILSIIMFIYLFYKKGIKYNIVIYYVLVFTLAIFIYSIFNSNISLVYFYLFTTPILFLITYTATDYKCSPTINETQAIYGSVLGLITAILSIFIHNLSIPLSIIICSLLLTKPLDKLSPKIKYSNRNN